MASYADLLDWSRRAGILSARDRAARAALAALAALAAVAVHEPDAARRVVRESLRLREATYRVFSPLADGRKPGAVALRPLVRAYGAALMEADLEEHRNGLEPGWRMDADLAAPLQPIAYQAGVLVLFADSAKVKECGGCGWLFVDRSRNRTRRWCHMATCGSRDKMRRYYRRRAAAKAARSRRLGGWPRRHEPR